MKNLINALMALAGAMLLAGCDDGECDCGSPYGTFPFSYRNSCHEPLLLTWTHRQRDHFAHLQPSDVASVSIFDGNGCEEHWEQGLPRTTLTVEVCDSCIVLMGWARDGSYYQASLSSEARNNQSGPRESHLIDLDEPTLTALAAEARAAGANK